MFMSHFFMTLCYCCLTSWVLSVFLFLIFLFICFLCPGKFAFRVLVALVVLYLKYVLVSLLLVILKIFENLQTSPPQAYIELNQIIIGCIGATKIFKIAIIVLLLILKLFKQRFLPSSHVIFCKELNVVWRLRAA